MENYYPKNNYFKLPLEKIMKKMMNYFSYIIDSETITNE